MENREDVKVWVRPEVWPEVLLSSETPKNIRYWSL